MVLVLKYQFFHPFVLGKKGQENVFHDILERKKSFYAKKDKKFKKSKNYSFSIQVSPWFWPKIVKFSSFDSRQNVFHDIVKRKNAFCRR